MMTTEGADLDETTTTANKKQVKQQATRDGFQAESYHVLSSASLLPSSSRPTNEAGQNKPKPATTILNSDQSKSAKQIIVCSGCRTPIDAPASLSFVFCTICHTTTSVDGNEEYEYWLTKVKEDRYGWALKDAPDHIRNDKKIVMAAVQKNGEALKYASPELQNDKDVVLTAVQGYGQALKYAFIELQNDKEVVMAAVRRFGRALEYASPRLRNDKEVVMAAVQRNGSALEFASPESQREKQVVLAAVAVVGTALEFAYFFRNNKEVVMAAVKADGKAIKYASPKLQEDKDIVLQCIKQYPDYIKHVSEALKRDRDVLIAAGMFDVDHEDYKQTKANTNVKKIVLSTRFSLNETSNSEANNFTQLFKQHKYIQGNKFKIYAPNAFDKTTCDPSGEYTDWDWPCRGTYDTCAHDSGLKTGHPTDDCCWRYSFRHQLQEAKDTGGFMVQLIEKSGGNDQILGHGQKIERDMAQNLQVKIFHVYRPMYKLGHEYTFNKHSINEVVSYMEEWYDDDCWDMSECPIIPSPHLI